MPRQSPCCCTISLRWSHDADVALLRAMEESLRSVPKYTFPNKRKLRSIRRAVRKTMGTRWSRREIAGRIRYWMDVEHRQAVALGHESRTNSPGLERRASPQNSGSRTRWSPKCSVERHGTEWQSAFRDASDFGVGTMNISSVSCCCAQRM